MSIANKNDATREASIGASSNAYRIAELEDQRTQLIAYLIAKVKVGDWHAIQDAASDIREVNAKLSILNGTD